VSNLLQLSYEGLTVTFDGAGWFNATAVAKRHGVEPYDWLRLPETKRYLVALAGGTKPGKSRFARTIRGGAPGVAGTWLSPKLAVAFARWLDVDFAVWCDAQIDAILRQQFVDEGAQRLQIVGALWTQRLGLEAKDASTKEMASVGSRLMLDRRRALPGIKAERRRLETAMQGDLVDAIAIDNIQDAGVHHQGRTPCK